VHRLTAHLHHERVGDGLKGGGGGHSEHGAAKTRDVHRGAGERHHRMKGQGQRPALTRRLENAQPMPPAAVDDDLPGDERARDGQTGDQAGQVVVGHCEQDQRSTGAHFLRHGDVGVRQQHLDPFTRRCRHRTRRDDSVPGGGQGGAEDGPHPTGSDDADVESTRPVGGEVGRLIGHVRSSPVGVPDGSSPVSLVTVATVAEMNSWLPWSRAIELALYGPDGFYTADGPGPADHFRTSVHASPQFARAVLRLTIDVDAALGHPSQLDLIDVGAGRGELLSAVLTEAPDDLRRRLRSIAVERAARPHPLPEAVAWQSDLPASVTGLVIANEWLDNVAFDVVSAGDDHRWQLLEVDTAGNERLAGPPAVDDLGWLTRWWPRSPPEPGERAEVGRSRDHAWADVVGRLTRGAAVAVDYHHDLAARGQGAWATGTLSGHRSGRQVAPVPDGSCDLTAHVALDACAAAGAAAGAQATWLGDQRTALSSLGVGSARPPIGAATHDPIGYVTALAAAGAAHELLDPAGLGGFGWLMQSVGIPLPDWAAGASTSPQ
jgi:SAM-dependent MidA family methyltransferase